MATKADLQALADRHGVEYNKSDTNAELETKLREAGHDPAEAEASGDQSASAGTVGDREANADLAHTEGGTTTRQDALDAGVPMLAGSPDEPQGPEDALGEGAKRGDYRGRVDPASHEARPTGAAPGTRKTRWVNSKTGAESSEGAKDAIEVVVDNEPTAELVAQAPRAEQIGEVAGRKGGVDSDSPPVKAAREAPEGAAA